MNNVSYNSSILNHNNILDLTSLEKTLSSLEYAIARSQREPADQEVRDSVIQRFEYSYELAWKMLKRRLELDSPSPVSIDAMSFKEMIREAAERGLIDNPTAWFEYRQQRNLTAHTYNDAKARQVYETALIFVQDVKNLLHHLKQRNV